MIKIVDNIEITEAIRFALDVLEEDIQSVQVRTEISLNLSMEDGMKPQSYHRKCNGTAISIVGADEAGIMYGLLDLGREICHKSTIDQLSEKKVVPYMENRGIKLNIPLDARTPSYSDASDSASLNIENMWDFSFWTEFLDRMAINRYNVLSLWSLSLFPSLVRIPEYPLTALADVKRSIRPIKADLSAWGMYADDMRDSLVTIKKMSIDEKIAFWQSVMDYAKKRCIRIFLFTWNLFVYGTEGTPYGITCEQSNPITKDYIYCGTKALLDTYPLLAGIGVTSGEHMFRDDTDIPFIADTYGRGIKDYLSGHPEREFRFIHRMQYTRYDSIVEEFREFPCPFEISFKYSQAHMYSSTKPAFIDSFLKEKDQNIKIWLTVRNDDFYMYRWGNPEYAREYLSQMPVQVMSGFYMGADGYTWGRDYMDLRDLTHPQFVVKMWYMFAIWGQLSYNIQLPDEYFRKELDCHFHTDSSALFETWKHASDIISEFNCVHWHDYDFQWYPEGCCMYDFEADKLIFADINEFTQCQSIPGGEYYSVSEYCKAVQRGDKLTRKDPLIAAESIWQKADRAMEGVHRIRRDPSGNQELSYTLDDIQALSYLGYYYSVKLRAAVALLSYRLNNMEEQKEEAVKLLKKAAGYWKQYAMKSKEMYQPQVLTRLCGYVDVERFCTLTELDILLASE